MLAKLTSKNQLTLPKKNQLTLPKKAVEALGAVTHFEVEVEGDHLVLRPACIGAASAVRRKLAELGMRDEDVAEAVAWARKQR